MTAELEKRYRRLLAVYPAAHRRAYEEETVGVREGPGRAGPRPGRCHRVAVRVNEAAASRRDGPGWRGGGSVPARWKR